VRTVAAAATSSAHARKRGRLERRTSAPSAPTTDGQRLNELLDRFREVNSRSCPGSTATSLTSSSTASSASIRQPMAEINGARSLGATRSLPPKSSKGGSPLAQHTARRTVSASDMTAHAAKPPAKPPTSKPKPFRPPLLNPGVRSSPRRAAAAAAAAMAPPASPLRGPPASPLTVRAAHPLRTSSSGIRASAKTAPQASPARSRQQPSRTRPAPAPAPAPAAYIALAPPPPPQPSSDADMSCDSFDGFFESGGAEMDSLFAAMDGL
jgi:hypothetical protein